jgi:hypothetical protein
MRTLLVRALFSVPLSYIYRGHPVDPDMMLTAQIFNLSITPNPRDTTRGPLDHPTKKRVRFSVFGVYVVFHILPAENAQPASDFSRCLDKRPMPDMMENWALAAPAAHPFVLALVSQQSSQLSPTSSSSAGRSRKIMFEEHTPNTENCTLFLVRWPPDDVTGVRHWTPRRAPSSTRAWRSSAWTSRPLGSAWGTASRAPRAARTWAPTLIAQHTLDNTALGQNQARGCRLQAAARLNLLQPVHGLRRGHGLARHALPGMDGAAAHRGAGHKHGGKNERAIAHPRGQKETKAQRHARFEKEYHAFVRATPLAGVQDPRRTMFSTPHDVRSSTSVRTCVPSILVRSRTMAPRSKRPGGAPGGASADV